jgi:uncharacterized delta-60 repeat protein
MRVWRGLFVCFAGLVALAVSVRVAHATDGDIDPTFGIDGKVLTDFGNTEDFAYRVAVQPDGKIVAIGTSRGSSYPRFALARYNPDGSLDVTFGPGGKVTTVLSTGRESATGLLILPGGKILISGSIDQPSTTDTSFALVRYNSDGSLDTTFGQGGLVTTNIGSDTDQAVRIALQSDGKVVAAGRKGIQFYPSDQRKGNVALARYNPDGSLDSTFGNAGVVTTDFGQGLESYAVAVMIQPDGKIAIAGEASYEFMVARYNANGTLDTTFGNDGFTLTNFSSNWDTPSDALLQPDGKILVVGNAEMQSPYDTLALARYNSDGSPDQSFGDGGKTLAGSGELGAVILQPDGKIVALGDDGPFFLLLRLNQDGSLDATFGAGGSTDTSFDSDSVQGRGLALQPDGKVVAAGFSEKPYYKNSDFALARYVVGSTSPTPAPSPSPTVPPSPTPSPTATATATATVTATVPPPTSTPTATAPPESSPTATSTPTTTPAPTAEPPVRSLNISTRVAVETGENVAIGGFIITGNSPKKVAVRGLGPSLQSAGISNALVDPMLELRSANQSMIASNDNWRDDAVSAAQLQANGLAPRSDLESAIVATLSPGAYTAVVSGRNGMTGMGLIEVYDLDQTSDTLLANISTRGLVHTGDEVLIGGFILGGSSGQTNILIRALGPSLEKAGIANAVANPTLELRNGNGLLLQTNDNWKDQQRAAVENTGLAPSDDREAAILVTLSPGTYTAVAAGKDGTVGVGLVEVFNLH